MENNYSEAIKLFDKSLKIKPDFWQAINNKGLAYFEKNNINLSIKLFETTTPAVCASDSIKTTPGTTGCPGKCPLKK